MELKIWDCNSFDIMEVYKSEEIEVIFGRIIVETECFIVESIAVRLENIVFGIVEVKK